jgi:hypothetical protein
MIHYQHYYRGMTDTTSESSAQTATPPEAAPALGPRKLSNAYWLWFFLGGVGGHQFYLGNKGRAVSYIFTGAWLTIGLWIDVFTMRTQLERTNVRRSAGQR